MWDGAVEPASEPAAEPGRSLDERRVGLGQVSVKGGGSGRRIDSTRHRHRGGDQAAVGRDDKLGKGMCINDASDLPRIVLGERRGQVHADDGSHPRRLICGV